MSKVPLETYSSCKHRRKVETSVDSGRDSMATLSTFRSNASSNSRMPVIARPLQQQRVRMLESVTENPRPKSAGYQSKPLQRIPSVPSSVPSEEDERPKSAGYQTAMQRHPPSPKGGSSALQRHPPSPPVRLRDR